jgi:1,4-alpha-glucan branching enzyme
MIHLRRNLDGVSLGLTGPSVTQQHLNDGAKVLAYHRWGAGANDQVMVIMNWSATSFGSYNLNFPENGRWYVNLNSDWTRYGSDFGNFGSLTVDVAGNSGTVAIAPYSVLILSRQAHPELDSDADGLLNGWEQEHFGDPLVAVATNDFDLDGADNLSEQAADTDPKAAGSVLKLLSASLTGGNLTLKWKGGVNVRQVLQKANTVTGTWTPVFTNNPPTPLTNSLVLAAPDAQSYFRISAGP